MTTALPLPRSTPEAQGIPSEALLAFVEAAEREACGLHSLMLLRHGQVIAEGWWAPASAERPHMLFSLSKSFTSTAVGLAIAEGRLNLDDAVPNFFPKDLPKRMSARWSEVRVRHLLSMSTGHLKDTMERIRERRQGNWVKGILEQAPRRAPGTHFVYNNGASYMLAAIIRQATGMNVREYLQPRLFAPLGIAEPPWETCPRGINCGGWGLSLRTEDIARFGQLYLQKGRWNGTQLLPEAWVEAATSVQIANGNDPDSDWAQGYGFQFWRCRHGAYRGDGAFGQFCVVLPEQDTVLALTGGMADMQAALTLVWKHLLPEFAADALAENATTHAQLTARLGALSQTPQAGAATAAIASAVSGREYAIEANPLGITSLVCAFEGGHSRLSFQDQRGRHTVEAGYGAWRYGETCLPAEARIPMPVAASGAWTDANTYTAQLWYYETPFCATLTCRFEGDAVTCGNRTNVSFGPTEGPPLVGKACNG
ncbi:MAG: serine hydrolase [Anaerolineae bacterium]|jgi:CubicO group peptidase (beta-lactamase class C family)|nr:serine hydrolase [Anaerolineae bacterium]